MTASELFSCGAMNVLLEASFSRSVFTSLTEKQDLKLWNWPAEIYQTLVDKFCVIEVI